MSRDELGERFPPRLVAPCASYSRGISFPPFLSPAAERIGGGPLDTTRIEAYLIAKNSPSCREQRETPLFQDVAKLNF